LFPRENALEFAGEAQEGFEVVFFYLGQDSWGIQSQSLQIEKFEKTLGVLTMGPSKMSMARHAFWRFKDTKGEKKRKRRSQKSEESTKEPKVRRTI
jgi:hypothetical protein